ncbi:MAG: NAD(P)H-hydrate epimerase [Candidatus Omnitrophica bacterium]|nr:NAD(P)H-hydrate epimerase [Candidatus Omnitrophota bacterium]
MHFLIKGLPSSGKTTLVKEIIPEIKNKRGFYTEEIRDIKGKRIGFKLIILSNNKEIIFAHQDFKTPFKISKYSIDVKVFEDAVIKELEEGIKSDCDFLIIDEIGKIELISEKFKETCLRAFHYKNAIATIPMQNIPYIKNIQENKDVCVVELKRENFLEVKEYLKMGLKVWDIERIRQFEQKAYQLGLSERILIENASTNMLNIIEKLNLGKSLLIVAGRGNNGADVLSCARKMIAKGFILDIVVLGEKPPNQECGFQIGVLQKLNVNINFIKDVDELSLLNKLLEKKDFVLDGLLGIGIKGEVSSLIKRVMERINESKKIVVSCDIPSGLDPQTGKILGEAIKSTFTITFIAPKKGFFLNDGPNLCGKIHLTDIGIPI